jgi:hypothetical protein
MFMNINMNVTMSMHMSMSVSMNMSMNINMNRNKNTNMNIDVNADTDTIIFVTSNGKTSYNYILGRPLTSNKVRSGLTVINQPIHLPVTHPVAGLQTANHPPCSIHLVQYHDHGQ